MASQKVRPTVLQRFFETSTYSMYAFTLEKPLRLVGRNFCLAISFELLAKASFIFCFCEWIINQSDNYIFKARIYLK